MREAPSSVTELVKKTVCPKITRPHMKESFYSPNCVLTCKEVCAGKHRKRNPKCHDVHQVKNHIKQRSKLVTFYYCRVTVIKGTSQLTSFSAPAENLTLRSTSLLSRYHTNASMKPNIFHLDCTSRDPWEGERVQQSRAKGHSSELGGLLGSVFHLVPRVLSPHCGCLVSNQYKGGDDETNEAKGSCSFLHN